jgi:hypothetical protein
MKTKKIVEPPVAFAQNLSGESLKEYAAKIQVHLEGVIAVKAETEVEAIQKIREKLRSADLDLDKPLGIHIVKILQISE